MSNRRKPDLKSDSKTRNSKFFCLTHTRSPILSLIRSDLNPNSYSSNECRPNLNRELSKLIKLGTETKTNQQFWHSSELVSKSLNGSYPVQKQTRKGLFWWRFWKKKDVFMLWFFLAFFFIPFSDHNPNAVGWLSENRLFHFFLMFEKG